MIIDLQKIFALSTAFDCQKVSYVDSISITALAAHTWYIQEQMVVFYQKPQDLFCARDTYFVDKEGHIDFQTNWNLGSTSGEFKVAKLVGQVDDVNDVQSHWHVGMKLLPKFLWGSYWIVKTFPEGSADDYEWAIISGGQPNIPTSDGKCKLKSGLWLFTKTAFPGQNVVDQMRKALDDLGYDTSVLVKVQHEGCTYQ
jgi:apolipoprotein D and lipocalin family protein